MQKSSKKILTFKEPVTLETFSSSSRDVTQYLFKFAVVDSSLIGQPEEHSETLYGKLFVGITIELNLKWRLKDENLLKVLFEYGKRHIVQKIKDGTLSDKEELLLKTDNSPEDLPFDPSRIQYPNDTKFEVEVNDDNFQQTSNSIKGAGQGESWGSLTSQRVTESPELNPEFDEPTSTVFKEHEEERNVTTKTPKVWLLRIFTNQDIKKLPDKSEIELGSGIEQNDLIVAATQNIDIGFRIIGIYRVLTLKSIKQGFVLTQLIIELRFGQTITIDDFFQVKKIRNTIKNPMWAERIEPDKDLDTVGILNEVVKVLTAKNPNQANEIRALLESSSTSEEEVKSKTKLEESPTTESEDIETARAVKTTFHSDLWTLEDQLGYSLYAKSIVEFIQHKDTNPPLTIGIYAPWGQGKTTFMRLIECYLKLKIREEKVKENDKIALYRRYTKLLREKKSQKTKRQKQQKRQRKERTVTKFRDLKKWMEESIRPSVGKLSFPTIWFNAWKYQCSDQVWAGMAHAIISQLVDQLRNPIEREKFWLALQYERLDLNAIRRDIHRLVFERILPKILFWALLGIISILLIVLGAILQTVDKSWIWLVNGGLASTIISVIPIIYKILGSYHELMNKPLEGKFSQYVRQPDYESKMGYLHEVEQDVRSVFKLLIDPEKPAVVFVDDLDRCSPGKVAEVFEAINLFLSGDFPNCYFIMGIDAQVVAACMEVAYKDLTDKLSLMTRSYGSLGWYFMDKFVQMPFCIPSLDDPQREAFAKKLFIDIHSEKEEDTEKADIENRIDEIKIELEKAEIDETKQPEKIVEYIQKQTSDLQTGNPEEVREVKEQAIEVIAQKFTDKNEEVQKVLERYAKHLGTSPRTIKRFANLYRFYRFTQWSRQLDSLASASSIALGRWLVIMLRWPQLVRWIQWEGEEQLFSGIVPEKRAMQFEKLVEKAKNYSDWINTLEKKLGTESKNCSWLRDEQLFDFLKTGKDDSARLVKAIKFGIW